MNNTYQTRELSEAAALLLNKQRLVEIKREKKVCWFIFDNQKECERISNEFFFGELMVNARTYYEAITRLKNRIFARSK
ncbi:MAG TPA: DUF5659 domain-containing protein [Candidatus Sulfotelmatobacter sp.]|jgi:hypothetical protein|nr:DUF5659 domain-containing protein [Candidatus Sulfotelmatobacter sp.]